MNPEKSSPAASPSACYDFSGGHLTSSGYALPSGMSAASMGLLARAYSRGGVILNDGRRVAAATILACNVQTISLPAGATIAIAGGAQFVAIRTAAATYIVVGGAQSNGLALSAGDTMTILDGGIASNVTIQAGGVLTVSGGGSAYGTRIMSGGVIEESGIGGAIVSATFDSGGIHRLANGASKDGLIVSGHILEVGSGGTATSATVNVGGTMAVGNGGITSRATINSGGTQNVLPGGIASGGTINDGGTQNVSSGGIASGGTINSGGTQNVLPGGIALGGTINSDATQNISSGGTASGTTIDSGIQTIYGGGTAYDTTLVSKGKQIVLSGGLASGCTLSGMDANTRGYQEVYSGGTAVGTVCSAYGNQTVTGGMALDTTVSSGGIQAITSGGVALNTKITSGGTQSCTSGGILAGEQIVEAGASASGGTLTEMIVDGITVKGEQSVLSGGTANNITVAGGGTQSVLGGGTANGVTLDGGALRLAPGFIASGTVGGHGTVAVCTDDMFASIDSSAVIPLGGTYNFSSFTVSGGVLNTPNGFHVNSGGGITVNSGGTMVVGGGVLVETSGSSLTVSGGGALSALSVSTESGGEISMSGGTIAASGGITVKHALTNAYGTLDAGTFLVVAGGATQPAFGEKLNLSAGSNITISGAATVNELSAGGDIDAAGQALSASRIRAGGALTAGSVTAASLSAASLSVSTNARISGGGILLPGGGSVGETFALNGISGTMGAMAANSISIGGSSFLSVSGAGTGPVLSAAEGIEIGDGLLLMAPAGGSVGAYGGGYAVLDASGAPAREVVLWPLPPVEASLKWKYAKNANGWFCAQIALKWHPAFAEGIENMRLLFADRTDAQGRRTAYLVDPATVLDPVAHIEERDGTPYRGVPIDLGPFAGMADGARAVFGVGDETMAAPLAFVPAGERKICLRVPMRNPAAIGDVSAVLAWESAGVTFHMPIEATVVSGDPAPARKTYSILFSANGGTGSMSAQTMSAGAAANLRQNAFARKGYVFAGWSLKKGGAIAYKNGQSVKDLGAAGKTVTLYAVWAKPKYKVVFFANDGTGKAVAQTFLYGKAARLRANAFARKGYTFLGWATKKDGKVVFKNKKKVKNLTTTGKAVKLYAVWRKD